MSKITLWFLQASRSIRTAWLLEELGLDYEIKFSPRENGVAPAAFKKQAGGLGKFPTLDDGELRMSESGNIAEYDQDSFTSNLRRLTSSIGICATPTTSSIDFFRRSAIPNVTRICSGFMLQRQHGPCTAFRSSMCGGTRKTAMLQRRNKA